MRWVIIVSVLYGIAVAGISLGLNAIGGLTAQVVFIPFVFLGGIGLGLLGIRRQM